jgi:simple sugar transport system permease protein
VSATDDSEVLAQTPASRLAGYLRGGGVSVPILTTLLAFFIGGLVMLVTGKDPIATYEAIWKGTGLQWVFPWTTGADRDLAASNLQQTLIITTPLILTGLAVAFAFRAGLFNIGGNGQYIVGSIAAVWVGSSFAGMPSFLHILLAIVAACAAGAFWAGIAGFLKATTGAHEVISTIMLNWIAVWVDLFRTTPSSRSRCPTRSPRARGCPSSGATPSCRASTSGCSSRLPRWSCSGSC